MTYTVHVNNKDISTGEPLPVPNVIVMRGSVKVCKMLGENPERMQRWAREIANALNKQKVVLAV